MHHLIGGIAPYMMDPAMVTAKLPLNYHSITTKLRPKVTAKLRPGIHMKGVNEAILELSLTLGTGESKPLPLR